MLMEMRITANSTALNNKSTSTSDIVTTQMMISGETFPAVCLQFTLVAVCLQFYFFQVNPHPLFVTILTYSYGLITTNTTCLV